MKIAHIKNEPFTDKTVAVDSFHPGPTVLHLIWGGRGRVIKGADYLRYAKRQDAPQSPNATALVGQHIM